MYIHKLHFNDSTATLMEIIEASGVGIYVINQEGIITYVNPKTTALLGYDYDELYDKNAHNLFHYKRLDGSPYLAQDCKIANTVNSGLSYESSDEVFWKKDALALMVSVNSSPIIRDNEIIGSAVVFRDITRQKELEQNLEAAVQKELEKAREKDVACVTLFDGSPIGVAVTDLYGFITIANPAFCEMVGYAINELKQKNIADLTLPEDMQNEQILIKKLYNKEIDSFKIQKNLIGKNGKLTFARLTVTVLKNSKGEIIGSYGFAEDITEETSLKKNYEEQQTLLARQEKMAAMGEMIGSIAHQWRQPLSQISIIKDTIMEAFYFNELDDEKLQNFNHYLTNAIDYMSETIEDFRNFYRPDKEKLNFNIKKALKSIINIVSARLDHLHIKTTIECLNDSTELFGYQNEFKQSILNIINNAIDALEENRVENPKIDVKIMPLDKKVKIIIQDNAGGIPRGAIDHIFESHFSTKGEKGSGIGLSISKNIIERNLNGQITVCNANGGACFEILI